MSFKLFMYTNVHVYSVPPKKFAIKKENIRIMALKAAKVIKLLIKEGSECLST